MTSGMIDKLQAVVAPETAAKPFRHMPARLTAGAIVGTLKSLGLAIPTKLATVAASGEPLRTAAHRFTLKEVDAALSKADVSITDRFRLKAAMSKNGILGT